MLIGQPADTLQEAICRLVFCHRLHYDSRYFPIVLVQHGIEGIDLVVAERMGKPDMLPGNPRITGGCSNKPVVFTKEGMAFAESNVISAGVSACNTQRRGCYIRAVLGKFYHLRTGDEFYEFLGCRQLERGSASKVRANRQLLPDRFKNRLVSVAENNRSQPHAPVDVLITVSIPYSASLTANENAWRKFRKLVPPLAVSVAAAGYCLFGPFGDGL